ncbi:hypothetical protein TMatcc_001997 [Talaromyces marneffei ATCC 18224]|uniref:F-box domain protein n=1 Tax=Talaromyces marneffei (strain ATCC 18224 / CBS 334.59 / QM 7333) TaxID=441960 RepID=B6QIE1_TALMQ|nr:uncharacterized protein EYB26_006821 [Talaromyces marneffei]EEA23136.1 hypothetical protein PMAA_097260 [Talaromyces marneffei ATCC 18224]QGA19133.1 hypothetical protein EYB26_006821 [Talaromyces marneffei]
MQRLPTEIHDRIVSYVKCFEEIPKYEDPCLYPPMYLIHKDARTALSNLRLVDKTFSRSASRALFGGARALLGHGVSSISKLETLSSSRYAQHVRLIQFDIGDKDLDDLLRDEISEEEHEEHEDVQEEVDEGGNFRLSGKAVNRLSSLITEFRNLKAVSIWPKEFVPLEKAIGFLSQIIITIADLESRGVIHKVTDLRLPLDGATHLITLLDNGDHQTDIRNFLQHVQNLDFMGFIGVADSIGAPTGLTDLDTLIKSSSNLLSLSILGDLTLISFVKFDLGLRLRLESLKLCELEITSYDLLALLEACKESMRFISLDYLELVSGSWLHVLVQIKKNLTKLNTFFFMPSDPYLDELGSEDPEFEVCFLWHALGDIQRQTNSNRIAAGLKPWTSKTYLHLNYPPLEVITNNKYYEELISQKWDAENSTSHC